MHEHEYLWNEVQVQAEIEMRELPYKQIADHQTRPSRCSLNPQTHPRYFSRLRNGGHWSPQARAIVVTTLKRELSRVNSFYNPGPHDQIPPILKSKGSEREP